MGLVYRLLSCSEVGLRMLCDSAEFTKRQTVYGRVLK